MGRGTIDCQEGRLSLLRGSWPPPPSAGFFLSSCHFSRPAACLVPSPAASASPGNLAEVPVLTPHPRPPEPETGGGRSHLCFNEPPSDPEAPESENHRARSAVLKLPCHSPLPDCSYIHTSSDSLSYFTNYTYVLLLHIM